MTRNYRLVSATNVLAMSIVLLLSVVVYPLAFMVYASTGPLVDQVSNNNLKSNNSGPAADPLSDAVLTIGDGTNVLTTESATGSDTGASSAGATDADSSVGSTSSDTSSDSSTSDTSTPSDTSTSATGPDSSSTGPTGEVGSSTGEVGSSTGEVGSSTGEVLPTDEAAVVGIIPPEGTGSVTGSSESTENTSSTSEGTTPVDNDIVSNEQPVTSTSPLTGSDVGSTGPEVGTGIADLSSSSSSASNANSLAAESVTAASSENLNAVVQPISSGSDPQTVKLGDIPSGDGKVPEWSLDKKQYKPGDIAVLTISDPAANRDPNVPNTVTVIIDGVPVTATEDGPNSGNFELDFLVKDKGNKLAYDATASLAQVDINGVTQGGAVELKEVPVSSFLNTLGQEPDGPVIGNAIQVSLLDGAQLDPSGSNTITLSYANAPAPELFNQFPSAIIVWQFVPGLGWMHLDDFAGPSNVNEAAKTVTTTLPLGVEGTFVLGFWLGGGGGGGGAIGLPGAGLVLDLVAPVTAENPVTSPQPVSESTTSVPETSLPESTVLNVNDDDTVANVSTSATQVPLKSAVGQGEESDVVNVSQNGNKTISVPGVGNVTLSFTNVISDGQLTVSAVKDSDLAGFKVIKNGGDPAKLMSLDNVPYSLAGNVFVIGPTDSEFKGTMTVSVPYDTALLLPGSDVRLLYYTGSGWEDVTTQTADIDLVSGSLSNLGVVAPALKSQAITPVSSVQ